MSAVTWGHEPLLQVRVPRMPGAAVRAAGRGVGRPAERVAAHPAREVVARVGGQPVARPTAQAAAPRTLRVVPPPAQRVVVGPTSRDVGATAGPMARRRAAGVSAGAVRSGAHGARAAVSARPAPSMHLTARGRVALVVLTAGLALWGALSAPSAVADRPGEARAVVTHTVAPGETLWRVAQSIAAPREDVRDVVDELIVLNGLASGELRAGQQILVPAG